MLWMTAQHTGLELEIEVELTGHFFRYLLSSPSPLLASYLTSSGRSAPSWRGAVRSSRRYVMFTRFDSAWLDLMMLMSGMVDMHHITVARDFSTRARGTAE